MDSLAKNYVVDASDLSVKLHQGSMALLPTDTLPALAASPAYVSQLWEIKKRPLSKPLILMGSSSNELFECVAQTALKDAHLMAKRFWPGALTMILPASGAIVDYLNPGQLTLGMRIPECEATLEVLSKSGPLATTSANLAGEPPSLKAEQAANCFPSIPLLGPLPWPIASGVASTLALWVSPGCWQVLRRGAVIIQEVSSQ